MGQFGIGDMIKSPSIYCTYALILRPNMLFSFGCIFHILAIKYTIIFSFRNFSQKRFFILRLL